MMSITRTYHFSAAHRLPNVPPEHKCSKRHGHNFKVEIVCSGPLDPTLGWIVDFGVIDAYWKATCGQLDHSDLNEIDGLSNPTSEILAYWIFMQMTSTAIGPLIGEVSVYETRNCKATYRRPT